MDINDIVAYEYVQSVKNDHAYALQEQKEKMESQIALANELYALRQEKSESLFRQRLALVHQNYSDKLQELQNQISQLVNIVKSKNADLARANEIIAELDRKLGNEVSNQIPINTSVSSVNLTDSQWFEIIDVYFFVSDIVENAKEKNLLPDATIKGKPLKQWLEDYEEIRKMMPSGKKLNDLLEKMENSLKK